MVVNSAQGLPANWWQAASWADLLKRLAPVRPQTEAPVVRYMVVGFGVLEPGCEV